MAFAKTGCKPAIEQRPSLITEIRFEDDPRVTAEVRERSRRSGTLVFAELPLR